MCVHKKIHKIGRVMLMVTAGLMIAGLIAAQAHAQSFTIGQNGKTVGSANLALKQVGGGLDLSSGAKISMSGLNFSFSQTQTLDPSYRFQNVQLSGLVNGTAATVNATAQGQNLQVKINANGKVTQTPLQFHPLAVFWPDFDPGALQVLLSMGAANNNRDMWAVVPKQTGSIVPLKIVTEPDEQGSMGGKLLTVHHLTVSMDTSSIEVFSGTSNELLQAEWTDEGFAMVRQGFKLTPPAKPRSGPPAAPPKPANGQNGQPDQNQPDQNQPDPDQPDPNQPYQGQPPQPQQPQ